MPPERFEKYRVIGARVQALERQLQRCCYSLSTRLIGIPSVAPISYQIQLSNLLPWHELNLSHRTG